MGLLQWCVAATSGAPFPSANNVTPAKRGGRPNWSEKCSRPGEKNSSVVELRRRKRRRSVVRRRRIVSVLLMIVEYDDVDEYDVSLVLVLVVLEEQKREAPNPTPSPSLHVFAN